jgi:cell fate (sporulation/competence/biofilm development) regulator YmcA (YheA/YmcA/DUF963 family)
MKRKYSDEEIKNAASEYFRIKEQVEKYKKWNEKESKLKDEDHILHRLQVIKKFSSKLNSKNFSKKDALKTLEQITDIEIETTTLSWMLIQILKDKKRK